MAETAIVVPVPAAAALVDPHRLRLTRAAAEGMPPHVTLLYPFTDDLRLTARREAEVADIVAATPPFDVAFTRIARFAGEPSVLYLAPEPSAPFAGLTRALADAYPEHPPYGDAHGDVIPHLTVAVADDATLDPVEAALRAELPLRTRVTEAWLFARADDRRWAPRRAFALGG